MATRSRIGFEFPDGSVLSAYHHWDGYPEWLGRILKTHYYDKSKAFELISGGDMSCCWTTKRWTNESVSLNDYVQLANDEEEVQEYGPQYYSQRGEENVDPKLHESFNTFIKSVNDSWGDYAYIFADGEWKCYTPKGNELVIPA
jgi:hypothetical protein